MELWHLWVVFAGLAVLFIFVSTKAAKAARNRREILEKQIEIMKKESYLHDKYENLTEELVREAETTELLEGICSNIQFRIEQIPDMTAAFNELPEWERYCYALNYFLIDSKGSLSEFFKKNGEPLISLAVTALGAVGSDLAGLVGEMFDMYDENNEDVSYDEEKIKEIDTLFREKQDAELLYSQIKTVIINAENAECRMQN